MAKPSNPKGTRDFLPAQMVKRSYIFDTIQSTFIHYGYQCIETPSLENLDTLTGKYGEEGDRLIFKVLNNGDYLKNVDIHHSLSEVTKKISSRALRYDLTVPFARFVTQHRDKITFPFKRYQIQPVWRADRPQKGRYREFFQCDADVVGSDSLLIEVEQVQMLDEVLSNLKIEHTIHINNRKILEGIAEISGQPEKLIDMTVALDKLDKIGLEGVQKELRQRGVTSEAIAKINPIFTIHGSWKEKLKAVEEMLQKSEVGLKGVEELAYVLEKVDAIGLNSAKLNFNLTLARGLSYYTGAIFEVTTDMIVMGSICGGGRYDDLTALFGMKGTPGVGISFGADRIYDVMEEAGIWPKELLRGVDVLFLNFGEGEVECLSLLKSLRNNDISGEFYPQFTKVKKQMKYANDKGILYVAMIGSEESQLGKVKLKNMDTGEEQLLDQNQLVAHFVNLLQKNQS